VTPDRKTSARRLGKAGRATLQRELRFWAAGVCAAALWLVAAHYS
jgi:hypothetical protein